MLDVYQAFNYCVPFNANVQKDNGYISYSLFVKLEQQTVRADVFVHGGSFSFKGLV